MNFNMKVIYFVLVFFLIASCNDDGFGDGGDVVIPDFNFPLTTQFPDSLSVFNIFSGNQSELTPNSDYHLLELSSVLFTDYAHKQRLIKVPESEQLERTVDGSIDFPNGSILVKTFYYYNDERDFSLGKRIIETRIMVKEDGLWNVATYIWNTEQSDAILQLDGLDVDVSWTDTEGVVRSTVYDVPDENECIACHQSNGNMIPLGTTLTNMNRSVDRNGNQLNLLDHLQVIGVLNEFNITEVPLIPDYNNTSNSIDVRARAYLHMNCSHCHNPNGWEEPAEQELDFRYTTPFNQTGIVQESDEIEELVQDGEMPFIGTTVLDTEGVQLIIDYLDSL